MIALLAYPQSKTMASLTIRKLDDAIRDELRLRAARNGRSGKKSTMVKASAAAPAPVRNVVAMACR